MNRWHWSEDGARAAAAVCRFDPPGESRDSARLCQQCVPGIVFLSCQRH